ncbi:MAG: hypothetical protein E7291_00165 [Lachnospiraceae bacterium]|nr:hypothetical protein [Lachnospiraceae bacterium]
MRYVRPDYFDEFRCTAEQCPDTCCAGWQIMIDDASLKKYAEDTSAFKATLRKGIDWQEGSFIQYNRRCSMLNEHNLCSLILEKGEDWLCETCSRYPRHVEEYEGVREWSLSLSCPVAAELILNRTEAAAYLVDEDDEQDPLQEEFEDFDLLLFTQLEDARKVIFHILRNRNCSIRYRKKIICELARKMQACVDENRLFDMDDLIADYEKYGQIQAPIEEEAYEDAETQYMRMCRGFSYLEKLERLREEWSEVLQETKSTLYSGGLERYNKICSEFQKEFGPGGSRNLQWELYQENLLFFFLYTYFCGAVYDDWIYSKAAFSIFSADFIQEFVMCKWILADKYIDMHDFVEIAYRYAREVEHSDENLNFLEECLNGEAT